MAKKIDAETVKTLKNLGITAKTEEEARKKLVAALEKEGIEGMEDESLAALIDMADGFLNDGDNNDYSDEVEEDEVEEEMNALADEIEEEETELVESEEPVDDEVEEDEVEEAEPVKSTKKSVSKKEKPAKKAKKSSRGQKLDPFNNSEDREPLEQFKSLFNKDFEYSFDYIKSNGVTVKHVGKNSKRGIFSIDNLTKHNDGSMTCNLYLPIIKQTEVLDELGIEYKICFMGPVIKNISLDEVKEILEKVFDVITNIVLKIDKRLGDNRKKMEENLKKTEKTSKVKKSIDVDDEVEEDEVEEAEPVKSTKKSVSKKEKPAKKAKK